MKIRTRVDLSKSWRFVFFAAYLTVLCGLIAKQMVAQDSEPGTWRRTNRGWEYAHSVPITPATTSSPPAVGKSDGGSETHSFVLFHRIALPLAMFSFLLTFSYWSLSEVPNRGIVRHMGESRSTAIRDCSFQPQ